MKKKRKKSKAIIQDPEKEKKRGKNENLEEEKETNYSPIFVLNKNVDVVDNEKLRCYSKAMTNGKNTTLVTQQ